MKNKDKLLEEKQDIMTGICNAVNSNDNAALLENMTKFQNLVQEQIRAEYDGIIDSNDNKILAARGVRSLTSAETNFWNKFISAAKSGAKDAIENIDVAVPDTTIDTVIDDIKTQFPLLGKLRFMNATMITKWIINKAGIQPAKWGKITSAYTEELSGSIEVIETGMYKLTAFMVIPKDILDMGPAWCDKYVRAILVESAGYGLEDGVINGTGADMPIGMIRDISSDAAVVSGAYPEKEKIKLDVITPKTIGDILAEMSVSEFNGRIRNISNLIFVCNPLDYNDKVMPATTAYNEAGGYVNNIMPLPIEIVQSSAVQRNTAVIADASRYNLLLGAKKRGFIERDDSVRFIQDEAVYATKLHANGRAGDDNDCKYLDITDLESAFWANSPSATAVSTKKSTS